MGRNEQSFLMEIAGPKMGEAYTYHGKTRLHSEGYFVKVEEERAVAKPL